MGVSMLPMAWPEPDPVVARAVRAKNYGRQVPLPVAVRDRFGELFADAGFAGAFGGTGPAGWWPGRLGLITGFRKGENLTARPAAQTGGGGRSWPSPLGL